MKDDSCVKNKCHKLATCKVTDDGYSAVGDYTCYCPDGYVGDGIGEEGCVKSASNVCQNHNCVNAGKCKVTQMKTSKHCYSKNSFQPTSDTEYKCECEAGFLGKFCEKTSPCQTNPCKNGGTCIAVENSAYCDCPEHFFGRACEEEEERKKIH